MDEKLKINTLIKSVKTTNAKNERKTLEECINDELALLGERVYELGKSASLTIKMDFKPSDEKDSTEVEVLANVSSKLPRKTVKNSLWQNRAGDFFQDEAQTKVVIRNIDGEYELNKNIL